LLNDYLNKYKLKFLFRSIKTEYWEQYLMKRFGGIDFLSDINVDSIDILNETDINQIKTSLDIITQSNSMIDPAKIVSLFRIYPPQASVLNYLFSFIQK